MVDATADDRVVPNFENKCCRNIKHIYKEGELEAEITGRNYLIVSEISSSKFVSG